jgi:hypothetical protein
LAGKTSWENDLSVATVDFTNLKIGPIQTLPFLIICEIGLTQLKSFKRKKYDIKMRLILGALKPFNFQA